MTRFVDGPAQGKTLMLKRAARFLRVTYYKGFKGDVFDALDQPEDLPRQVEKLFAYEIVSLSGAAHINCGRGKGSGFYPIAEYRFVTEQPTDEQMRDGTQWHNWCVAHPQRDDLPPQK